MQVRPPAEKASEHPTRPVPLAPERAYSPLEDTHSNHEHFAGQPGAVDHAHRDDNLLVHKAHQAVWYFFSVVATLLALRVILFVIGANPANPFFALINALTSPLAAPFANLVESPRVGSAVLELGTLFAMAIYLLLAIAVVKLFELLLSRGDHA